MAFLRPEDSERIAAAIRQVEARTSGELVTVVAAAADRYAYIPLLWASILALLSPGVLLLLGVDTSLVRAYLTQLLTFVLLSLLFDRTPLKVLLVPKKLKHRQARRLAREQFYANGIHLTRGRTGVLLFVSAAERYVEILADQGIHQRVEQGTWDGIVADFVRHVRQGQVTEGFLAAIASCGEILAVHCPRQADDRDELPDRLIQI
jgi:putative membrane protein